MPGQLLRAAARRLIIVPGYGLDVVQDLPDLTNAGPVVPVQDALVSPAPVEHYPVR